MVERLGQNIEYNRLESHHMERAGFSVPESQRIVDAVYTATGLIEESIRLMDQNAQIEVPSDRSDRTAYYEREVTIDTLLGVVDSICRAMLPPEHE